jgi:hypothetical protein
MEVASPLAFVPVTGNKRGLSCSPTLIDSPGRTLSEMDVVDDGLRSVKRRRFHMDTNVDSLSEVFSSHSPFFTNGLHNKKSNLAKSSVQAFKRLRNNGSSSPLQNDLKRVVDEQAAAIESYKQEKAKLESSQTTLKADFERSQKENQLLRKAVTIQQERQNQAEIQLKAAQEYRTEAEERVRKLEQMVLSLRYHLQAQQPNYGNDFMGFPPRPPDVF